MSHEPELFASAIWLSVSLVALLLVFQHVYYPAMITGLRENIFTLRRQLFLLMAEGRIEPTHPAYVRLRGAMNGLIRHAERVSLARMILAGHRYHHLPGYVRPRPVDNLIDEVADEETRKQLHEIRMRLGGCILLHCVVASRIVLLFVVLFLIAAIPSLLLWGSVKSLWRRLAEDVEPLAEFVSSETDECPDSAAVA